MALKLSHMLASSGLRPAPMPPPHRRLEPVRRDLREPELVGPDGTGGAEPESARRTRIWEFDNSLHCSIIGTCLTTAELRHVLEKLKVANAATASDHELHASGVVLAAHRQEGAKFLQKTLDRQHRTAISRYAKAKDVKALLELWEDSLKQGDIPGAYWAVMTHPLATKELIKRAFGDVHMLSHLVGSANRADIRRLRQLEQDNAALAGKIERQQRQLQNGFAARDQMIQRLNEMLAKHGGAAAGAPEDEPARDGAEDLIRDLNKRLAREVARRERAEQKAGGLASALAERERALEASRRECAAAQHDIEVFKRHLAALAEPEAAAPGAMLDLSGVALLYVGGRAHHVPQLKGLIKRAGGQMLHHDGGIEHSPGLLPGLIGRADHVVFPVDCISHDAAATIKRVCRTTGKTYAPLRSASVACLVSALTRMREPSPTGGADRAPAE